jgi:hypothetical protein
MALGQRYTNKLVEKFGVGARLLASVTHNYVLYDLIGAVPGEQLEIRLLPWQRRHTPGLFDITIKSETEVEEKELEGASEIFRQEYEKSVSILK